MTTADDLVSSSAAQISKTFSLQLCEILILLQYKSLRCNNQITFLIFQDRTQQFQFSEMCLWPIKITRQETTNILYISCCFRSPNKIITEPVQVEKTYRS